MNQRAILSAWEARWKQLAAPHRESFLARPEVATLATMPDEAVRMSIRAHPRLTSELDHARWLDGGRRERGACGCEYDLVEESSVHKLVILPGPATRVGGRSPSSATALGRCSCGWERRGGSDPAVRSAWRWHVDGDDEIPVEEYL
jgi:hypothetical protein